MTDTLVHPWMVHPHTGEPLRAVGLKANGDPIWPIMGASEDDDPDDEDEDDPDDEGEDDPDDEEDPYKDLDADQLRTKLKERDRSKRKDIARIKRMRERAKAGTKPKADDDPDRKFTRAELDEIKAETEESVRTAAHAVTIRYASERALARAGFVFAEDDDKAAAQLKRALKLMDTEDVEVDEDGEVHGLADAVAGLKEEFPNLFGKAGGGRQRKRPGNVSGNGKPTERKKSVTELQAEALFAKR
jgi:hypothetical protein